MSGHEVLLSIAGGVALLLWATRMVRTGIMRAYGPELRRLIGQTTRTRLSAFSVGLGVAGLLQSSTATALLANTFAARGLLTVMAGLAIMLGADVGSTLVVQVLSFDITWASPALILVGVICFMASSASKVQHIGRILIGVGLLLLSLTLIVGASAPLRGSEVLQSVVRPLAEDPILALLLAAVLTWIAHSSVAVVLLVMSLATSGVVPLELAFALVLGANIGSGIIPMMLTLSAGPISRRIPLGNLLFRVVGAVIALPLIGLAAPLVGALEGEPARQVANFHTAFNLILAAVFLPLTGFAAGIAARLIPDREDEEAGEITARYLDYSAVATPAVAMACATREVMRMADLVEIMLRGVIDAFESNDAQQVERLTQMDDDVDALHEAIKLYLTEASRQTLDEQESARCVELITFTTNLEHIGDIIEKNLLELAAKKIRKQLTFSEEGWAELKAMHGRVVQQMQLAMSVFVSRDVEIARRLLSEKEQFRDLEREGSERHLERLRDGQVQSIETSALHLDMLRDLKRIHSHLTSVAYPILETEGALRPSRLIAHSEAEASETEADAHGPENEITGRRPAGRSRGS